MARETGSPLSILLEGVEYRSGAPALIFPAQSYSYDDVLDHVRRRAAFFAGQGVVRGAKVTIYSQDDFEIIVSVMALWGLGATAIPMNVTLKPDYLRQIEAIFAPDMGVVGKTGQGGQPTDFPTIAIESADVGLDLHPDTDPQSLAMILFTSGTSGVPKAVPIRNAMIYANATLTALRLGLTENDRILINTPAYTTSSLIHVLTLMAAGGTVVIDRTFSLGATILGQIAKHECTGFGGVPVHFRRIHAALENETPPPSLRFLMNSGEHLPVPVIRGIREDMPAVAVHCVYGLTEVAGRLCLLPPSDIDDKIGSVGFPLDGMRVTIRDGDANELPGGEIGEVYVDGPNLMDGYINNAEANAKAMTAHGFATGDLGYKDLDGYLFLVGRNDDVLKVGGEKVSLNMIEQEITGRGLFKDFAVAPYEDKNMGLVPALFYVLEERAEDNWKPALLAQLRKALPKTHIPVHFFEVTEIPHTSSGKANRKALTRDFAG